VAEQYVRVKVPTTIVSVIRAWRHDRRVVFGGAVLAAVVLVGAWELSRELSRLGGTGGRNNTVHIVGNTDGAAQSPFDYLAPAAEDDWKYDSSATVFDASKGVVNYKVQLTDGGGVIMSQQQMPAELKPQTSAKFTQFILANNVAQSRSSGKGTVYFQPALTNGSPANGATTVIYATDDILMFGRATAVLPYDKWVKLLGGMAKVPRK
jgi:hypothetical protein